MARGARREYEDRGEANHQGPQSFNFYEQCVDDVAFDARPRAPHFALYRERRDKEGLMDGPADVDTYRLITD